MNKYLKLAISTGAAVVGAIVARDKALDVIEIVEKTFTKKPSA